MIVQNLATEYEDEGEGKTLLFLHGWQSNLHTFDPLVNSLRDSLEKTHRFVRLDLPGFGGSERPREDWDLDKYVYFVSDFVKKMNLDVYALVGHSMGGRIIIKGVSENILKTEKIVLISSAGIAKRKTFRNRLLKFLAKTGRMVTCIPPFYFWREGLRRKMYQKIGSRDYLSAGAMRGTFVRVINEDLSINAQKVNSPALLVWGENDTETPLSDGMRLSKMIAGSELNVLKGCGHFVHEEKAQEVGDIVEKFLC